MKFKVFALTAASLVAIAAPSSAAKPAYGDWGYDAAAMDRSVKPGDDFWAYVNGTWDKTTKIAPDRASAGPFITLPDAAERDVREVVEQLGNGSAADRTSQQVGDF